VAHQPANDVAAHPAEADHAELHLRNSLSSVRRSAPH
jgi:hypothetical protein